MQTYLDRITCGDCKGLMKALPENSIDAIVTDPPYGLEFMGKEWDKLWNRDTGTPDHAIITGRPSGRRGWSDYGARPQYLAGKPAQDWHYAWAVEALRVLKPGGHALVFGGTRTSHRLICGLEDAGFEIRDTLCWLYGSGFPKSMDISKAIDKMKGVERQDIGNRVYGDGHIQHSSDDKLEPPIGTFKRSQDARRETAPATPEAREWDGYGTGLKPGHEPICLARKPIPGSNIAENVLKWGTGGLNIDGCRISGLPRDPAVVTPIRRSNKIYGKDDRFVPLKGDFNPEGKGRFPANVLLSHTPECVRVGNKEVKGNGHIPKRKVDSTPHGILGKYADQEQEEKYFGTETVEAWECSSDCSIRLINEQSGISRSSGGSGPASWKGFGGDRIYGHYKDMPREHIGGLGDVGGASRFFYTAKAGQEERFFYCGICEKVYPMASWEHHLHGKPKDELDHLITHPTQKPVDLVKYLVKLVTPPGGIVLDPFVGTGTTAVACRLLGQSFIGFDSSDIYCKIAERRLKDYPSLDRWVE